jgi:hypothetical protein
MGLSDREQKLLEELERGLMESDSGFANRVGKVGNPGSRLVGGALLAVVGLGVLVTAVILPLIPMGIAGFLLMLAGLVLATSNISAPNISSPRKSSKPRDSGPNRNFFEDRWDRRQGDQ